MPAIRPYDEDPTGEYGLTLHSPASIGQWIQQQPGVILRGYFEPAWGLQDVLILYKKSGYFGPLF